MTTRQFVYPEFTSSGYATWHVVQVGVSESGLFSFDPHVHIQVEASEYSGERIAREIAKLLEAE